MKEKLGQLQKEIEENKRKAFEENERALKEQVILVQKINR